jgi:hypothetical protein
VVSATDPRGLQLLAHAGSSLADFSTLKMEAIRSSEKSVQSTTSTRPHTPEDGILQYLFNLLFLMRFIFLLSEVQTSKQMVKLISYIYPHLNFVT